ncbi:MAG: MFS transporter, partial [Acidimicrobiales bacterium]
WELVVMAIVFGSADAFFYPASTAIVPEIVPSELLTDASALSFSTSMTAQSLAGPALGGLFAGVIGIGGSLLFDAGTFVASIIALTIMGSLPARTSGEGERPSIVGEVMDGLRYTFQRQQRWLSVSIVAASLANFAAMSPQALLIPLLVRRVLHGSAIGLGLVFAGEGLGGTLGAVLAARFKPTRRRILWMWVAWAAAGGAIAAVGFAPDLVVVGALLFLGSGLLLYGSTIWSPLMQELVPRELLGRASSVDWLFSLSLSPVGVLIAGVLAGGIGVRATIVIGGSTAMLAGFAIVVPGVRDPDRGPAALGGALPASEEPGSG